MALTKLLLPLLRLRYFVVFGMLCLVSSPLPLQASPTKLHTLYANNQQNLFTPPQFPDNGAPVGRRRGGTSRNDCPALNIPLTALVPGQEKLDNFQGSTSFLAATISEYPTFWVYIPDLPSNIRHGEFILQNEIGEDIYRTSLKLPSISGVININLPSEPRYSLKLGQKYHWYFKIYCGLENSESKYFYVDAWIERIALTKNIDREIKSIKSHKYLAYFHQKIWYDAITELGQLLQTNSQNNTLKTDWAEILKSIDLSDIAQEPVLTTESKK
ncbi:DUF928 domain-containing protein [Nostoc sp. CMAA1605]|uniref:DUF928 domain-containing protein n=1 Tax=Nostoc sp. CMAA1605 TaxID=2055159 RepID=UPI001F48F1F8|nr:DUF928 domain-containing protein [Nostoc sp. CMAA1605]MCF4965684.1 hypothetical protein [Nostoc sp. CMAA1605]